MDRKKIVIVEDNANIRQGFAEVIEASEKYDVAATYSNCEDAIKSIDDDCPDLILMDIDLPGMTGIEGTLKIKKLCPECIIVIITVYEDSQKVFQSLCAGAGGYIIKNSNIAELVKSIDEAFAGGAPMSFNIAAMVVRSFNMQPNSPLSAREQQVLQAIAQGKTYTKIADELFINKETVRSHIRNIYQKLAVNSKAEAIRVAGDNKWINSSGY